MSRRLWLFGVALAAAAALTGLWLGTRAGGETEAARPGWAAVAPARPDSSALEVLPPAVVEPANEAAAPAGEASERAAIVVEAPVGNRLSGVALWPGGEPAANAEVALKSAAYELAPADRSGTQRWSQDGRVVRTDDAGAFELEGLGPGPFLVRARRGREGARWYCVVAGAAPGASLRMVLAPPVTLAGRVLDDAGGAVTAFELELRRLATGAEEPRFDYRRSQQLEHPGGAFTFGDLERGTYVLRGGADGHGRALPLELVLDGTRLDVVVTLERASRVAGTLVDPSGAAVEGGLVAGAIGNTASAEVWDLGEVQVDVDASGAFELPDLPPGPLTLRAYHPDWATSADVQLELLRGQQRTDLAIFLRAGGRLVGRVFDVEGHPDADARVDAEFSDAESSRSTYTDSTGRFTFERLTPGRYQVVANWGRDEDQGDLAHLRLATAEVVEGETAVVELGRAGAGAVRLTGRVTERGEPVADARVIALGEGTATLESARLATTDAAGTYALVLPGGGPVTFAVWRGERPGAAAQFHAQVPERSEARLDFELPTSGIEVLVRAPDGGPATGVPVAIAREDSPLSATSLFYAPDQLTGGGGRHLFSMLSPGSYTVRAGGEDEGGEPHFGRALATGIVVAPGAGITQVALDLRPAAEVNGRVLRSDGSPAEGAAVYVRDGAGRTLDPYPSCYADGQGFFRYRGVSPGGVSVFARTATLAAAETVRVQVQAGGSVTLELRLAAGTTLELAPVDAQGRPVAAVASVRDEAGNELAGLLATNDVEQVLASGISSTLHRVGPLPAGRYEVELACPDGRRAARAVTLDGRPSLRVELAVQ